MKVEYESSVAIWPEEGYEEVLNRGGEVMGYRR